MAEVRQRSDRVLENWPALRVAEWADTRDTLFDFCDHQLRIRDSGGAERTVALAAKPVARFYAETTAALRELGLDVAIRGYSHELSSCGFWPGGGDEGAFYAYAYPDGFRDHPIRPDTGYYSSEAGQFLLPYEAVCTAPGPDHTLLEFLQTTYEAAAVHGGWDRDALADDPVRRAGPR